MHLAGISFEEATSRLETNNGFVRLAIQDEDDHSMKK
jgi:N-acetylmuramic acid 6-phosphate (MurNAc-6-P) etherase